MYKKDGTPSSGYGRFPPVRDRNERARFPPAGWGTARPSGPVPADEQASPRLPHWSWPNVLALAAVPRRRDTGRASAAGGSGSAASASRQRHMNCPERNTFRRRGHVEPRPARTAGGRMDHVGDGQPPTEDARPYLLMEIERPYPPAAKTRGPTCRRKSTGPTCLAKMRAHIRLLKTRGPTCRRKSTGPTRRHTPGSGPAAGGWAVLHPDPRQACESAAPGRAGRSGAGIHEVQSRRSRHPASRRRADG